MAIDSSAGATPMIWTKTHAARTSGQATQTIAVTPALFETCRCANQVIVAPTLAVGGCRSAKHKTGPAGASPR
jgi:hypothetical protein